ncbi:MAG TPA: SDR family oxidoreductase [Chloroflexota bacterium]|nr:SDR family oxidoreductase [Chloroflexota bacterium]
MSLLSQVVLITGASRGLGRAVARRLADDGASLVLAARNEPELAAAGRDLVESGLAPGQQVICMQVDVTCGEDVERLVDRALGLTGRLDVLVCNAGVYGPLGLLEDVAWEEWVDAIHINLMGTVLCCRGVVPAMRRQGAGKIILLSGGGATQPLPRLSAYAASKAAVVRFGETLAEEVKDAGIAVNVVAPGSLNTRLLAQVLEAGPERVGREFYDRAVRQSETGGTPLDIPADLIAFLASTASDGVTGRLLSAVWDDWRGLPALRDQLAGSDVYTLRRIVPEDRGWSMP